MRNSRLTAAVLAGVFATFVVAVPPASADDEQCPTTGPGGTWKNDNSKLCMSVDGSKTWGKSVNQYRYVGAPDQHWHLGRTMKDNYGHFYYEIVNELGLCLAAGNNGNTVDGTPLVQWECNGATDQFWWPRGSSSGPWELVNFRAQSKCAGVIGGSKDYRAPLVLWTCNGNADQKWW
ncbi:RICIN domain-containing protein [Microbispora sp. NEAU-D428]|uniref:RICIN domain-containing protein n=1 Tax=Microbispora sitophila TaxID=2771537 RepID=UPI001865CCEF|nr:RICIN domain-containing protein [Microbispora sitophila]MBE3012600.1 RICIN domain-containing protein [Microbispora sitophila]